MGAALHAFVRRKDLNSPECLQKGLPRVLNSLDLTFLGVGSTLGAGVYVVTADVAKNTAGPGVVISFLVAAIASILCALCYAEFGSRVPKAGSAYVYTYVTIGELAAFVVGWNLLLEYLIGAAAVARAWTTYVDSLTNNEISHNLMMHVKAWHTPGISAYPDFLSLALCVFISLCLAVGVRISSWFNTTMTFINLIIIAFIILLGTIVANPKNWSPFLPFGFSGALAGSATAFFAFVGFDVIAASAEEVKNPATSIPNAIVTSLAICFLGYAGVAATLTLMVPYNELKTNAALPEAFHQRGLKWAKYVIASGAVAGLTSSLVGSMFPVPRLLYSMADDGLLFAPFAKINKTTKTPIFSTVFTGFFTGWLAMYFDLSTLVEMMSIGTLQAYTMVAASVLLLRYQILPVGIVNTDNGFAAISSDSLVTEKEKIRMSPTKRSYMLVKSSMFVILVDTMLMGGLLVNYGTVILHGYFWAIVSFFFLLGILTVAMTIIMLQPQNKYDIPFSVPFVPVLPIMSIFINMFLMMSLSAITWARFTVWMAVGLTIYLFYGVQHSKEDLENKQEAARNGETGEE
ncbi:probable cationic amino acid transporter [Hydractinia symbiolongicarpus]|uniref:probable cationic amino acid transporter n=1 Tax=Hydractinia symbiolongicarpus TaxID=13093 RepID=UPI002550F727|nr:probable cationic amino acid transporter [Hydractinia symbiolongicarpus]